MHALLQKFLGGIGPTGLFTLTTFILISMFGCCQNELVSAKQASPIEVVRTAIAKELAMEVSLKVETFRQNDDWVFLSGLPLTAAGEPIDYENTRFAADITEGYFDDGFLALVKRTDGGNWSLVVLSLGATDAPFVDWPAQFGAPEQLVIP